MLGLSFENAPPVVRSAPTRMDVACFIGWVPRRADAPLPDWLTDWLAHNGWLDPEAKVAPEQIQKLHDVPVPIDTWEVFDHLFAWEQRPARADVAAPGEFTATYLGAAVRNFFSQGGRKCYVVRLGDPWPLFSLAGSEEGRVKLCRNRHRQVLADGLPSPSARETWRGVGHVFGLPDVSLLCVPDLPDLFANDPVPQPESEVSPLSEERFVECADHVASPSDPNRTRRLRAPRCDESGYEQWSACVGRIGQLLARHAREVQFIGAVPLPVEDTDVDISAPPSADRVRRRGAAARSAGQAQWSRAGEIQTAFVQLTYPWIRSRESTDCPEALASPDGFLAGLLANNALTRAAWRSAGNLPAPHVSDLEPIPDQELLFRDLPATGDHARSLRLLERVSLFAPTPGGFRLISDVTTDDDEAYRPASLNRLVSVIVRAARLIGEDLSFQNSGEALWGRVHDALSDLLAGLWQDGALAGTTPEDAFEVRCDRSTMTQDDLDNGRVIARVQFTPAPPIAHITVVLALNEGGQVSLVKTERSPA